MLCNTKLVMVVVPNWILMYDDINGVANSNHSSDIAIINTNTNSVIDYINVGGAVD